MSGLTQQAKLDSGFWVEPGTPAQSLEQDSKYRGQVEMHWMPTQRARGVALRIYDFILSSREICQGFQA